MKLTRLVSVATMAALLAPSLALAVGVFPDVGDNHPFKGEIEALFRAGVVKGNPDGKYYPDKGVNRAEFLKLLYGATGRIPKPVYAKCFTDVESGSWYELYVCDAASKDRGFVQGYGDGTFRPGNPVSRTEALKMVFMVFGLPVSEVTLSDKDVIKFVDISTAAWYTKYISSAYKNGILPIYGFGAARFYPEKELTRGEAAAFIFNAQHISAEANMNVGGDHGDASSSGNAGIVYTVKQVSFPFNDTGVFQRKLPTSYVFDLNQKTTVSIEAEADGATPSTITCRLYLVDESGFSSEYFLGVQDDTRCRILPTVRPGKYQLQLQPSSPDIPYNVNAKTGESDGSDGFMDTQKLVENTSGLAGKLEANDLYDWFTFTVATKHSLTILLSSSERMECIVYSPASIDQFGFRGPECGLQYEFQPGTYTIGVGRKNNTDRSVEVDYTVKLK